VCESGGRIAAIARLGEAQAKQTIDARGHAVCPGFIDMHSHPDFTLLLNPRAESKIRQGVTTEVFAEEPPVGPTNQAMRTRTQEALDGAGYDRVQATWTGVADYLDILEKSGTALNAPGTSQTPNQIGSFRALHGIATQPWFDTSAFATPVGPVLGNMSRNAYRGPGRFNLDASLFRRFVMTERVSLELRAEAFGVTNTPQFGNPNTSLTSSSFGLINAGNGGAGGSRSMQLGGKIVF